jgi:hypothetical protein
MRACVAPTPTLLLFSKAVRIILSPSHPKKVTFLDGRTDRVQPGLGRGLEGFEVTSSCIYLMIGCWGFNPEHKVLGYKDTSK